MADTGNPPAVTGFHHFSPTVSDLEASAAWYARIFAMQRVPVDIPHHGDEDSGHAVLLIEPRSGISIGLHHHRANPGRPFSERNTGLDHIAWAVAAHEDLEAWAQWLDAQGVAHSGVVDATHPVPYSVVVFRDPDDIQLELIHMPA